MKFIKNYTKIQIGMIIAELIMLVMLFVASNRSSELYPYKKLISLFVIIISAGTIYVSGRYIRFSKEMAKYGQMVHVIDNIVRVTAMNYFYAYKMKRKFDINKISKLDKNEYQFAYVPDMLDSENEATEDEIKASIQYMKDWNVGVIHTLLTNCLTRGYINGDVRRVLINHGISGINNINNDSFIYQGKKGDKDYYKMNLQFEDGTERYS